MFEPLKVGDRLSNFTGLGVLGTNLSQTGTLAGDSQLLYRTRFNGPQVGLAASVSSTASNIDLEIVHDANNNQIVDPGEILGRSANPVGANDALSIRRNLGTGLYYYRLTNQTSQSTPFDLRLESDDAGSTPETARGIGVLTPGTPLTVQGGFSSLSGVTIGSGPWDTNDVLRFRITTPQDITLEPPAGRFLQATLNGVPTQFFDRGNEIKQAVTLHLEPGVHYVSVSQSGPTQGADRYEIKLTSQAAPSTPSTLEFINSVDSSSFITANLYNTEVSDVAVNSNGDAAYAYTAVSPNRGFIAFPGSIPVSSGIQLSEVFPDIDLAYDGANNLYASANGANGSLIIKYGSNGTELWRKQISTDRAIEVRDIAVTSAGEVYVTGDSSGSAWIGKYDTSGNRLWQNDIRSWVDDAPGGRDFARYIALDGQGNVVVSGAAIRNGEDLGGFAVKYSSNGQQRLWSTQVQGPATSRRIPAGLVLDGQANVYVAQANGIINKLQGNTGSTLWTRTTRVNGATLSSLAYNNGYLYAVGTAAAPGVTTPTAFVTQFTTAGQEASVQPYLPRTTKGTAIAVDRNYRIYVGGTGEDQTPPDFTVGDNAFLARLRGYGV
jgi:hypothetical protein